MRAVLAATLVLAATHTWRGALVKPLIPLIHFSVGLVAPEFALTSEDVVQQAGSDVLRIRANLSAPIEYAGRRVRPFGWDGAAYGGFEVTRTLGSMLQSVALMLIVILAWPISDVGELAMRLTLAVPLAALLFVVDTPLTIVAELWNLLRETFDPGGSCAWMIWSRFLQGGGALMLGGLAGCVANTISRCRTTQAS